MIQHALRTFILLLMLSLTGCLYTLNPPYNPEDVVFDPQLIGTWSDEGAITDDTEQGGWIFKKLKENSYELEMKGDEKSWRYEAHLFRLGSEMFLECSPLEEKENETLLLPYHMIYKVNMDGERIAFSIPDSYWGDAVKEGKIKTPYIELSRSEIILTAPTKELRKLFLKYGKEAYKNGESRVELHRENK